MGHQLEGTISGPVKLLSYFIFASLLHLAYLMLFLVVIPTTSSTTQRAPAIINRPILSSWTRMAAVLLHLVSSINSVLQRQLVLNMAMDSVDSGRIHTWASCNFSDVSLLPYFCTGAEHVKEQCGLCMIIYLTAFFTETYHQCWFWVCQRTLFEFTLHLGISFLHGNILWIVLQSVITGVDLVKWQSGFCMVSYFAVISIWQFSWQKHTGFCPWNRTLNQ